MLRSGTFWQRPPAGLYGAGHNQGNRPCSSDLTSSSWRVLVCGRGAAVVCQRRAIQTTGNQGRLASPGASSSSLPGGHRPYRPRRVRTTPAMSARPMHDRTTAIMILNIEPPDHLGRAGRTAQATLMAFQLTPLDDQIEADALGAGDMGLVLRGKGRSRGRGPGQGATRVPGFGSGVSAFAWSSWPAYTDRFISLPRSLPSRGPGNLEVLVHQDV